MVNLWLFKLILYLKVCVYFWKVNGEGSELKIFGVSWRKLGLTKRSGKVINDRSQYKFWLAFLISPRLPKQKRQMKKSWTSRQKWQRGVKVITEHRRGSYNEVIRFSEKYSFISKLCCSKNKLMGKLFLNNSFKLWHSVHICCGQWGSQ